MNLTDIVVILNPKAGRRYASRQQEALQHLLQQASRQTGCTWQIVPTTRPGEAISLARQAALQGTPIVVAAGGDGTCGEVVNGLMGTDSQLGILPLGTGNDFARCAGISENLAVAVETLVTGKARPIDVGWVAGRWFINVAGCGFDAAVAQRVNRGYPILHGTGAYVAAVYQTLLTFKPVQMHITVDDEEIDVRAMLCSVANSQSYGGGMRIAPLAQIDDGLLDVCIVKAVSKIEFIRTFPSVFRGTHITHSSFWMLKAKRVKVISQPPVPLLIDGDVEGSTPTEFRVVTKGIRVILPAK